MLSAMLLAAALCWLVPISGEEVPDNLLLHWGYSPQVDAMNYHSLPPQGYRAFLPVMSNVALRIKTDSNLTNREIQHIGDRIKNRFLHRPPFDPIGESGIATSPRQYCIAQLGSRAGGQCFVRTDYDGPGEHGMPLKEPWPGGNSHGADPRRPDSPFWQARYPDAECSWKNIKLGGGPPIKWFDDRGIGPYGVQWTATDDFWWTEGNWGWRCAVQGLCLPQMIFPRDGYEIIIRTDDMSIPKREWEAEESNERKDGLMIDGKIPGHHVGTLCEQHWDGDQNGGWWNKYYCVIPCWAEFRE